MQKIFVLLRTRTGHDFSCYKSATIRRRIERRMNLHQIKQPVEYVYYLQENAHEIDVLFKELLISVTNFFRDLEAFEALAKSKSQQPVLEERLKRCRDGETVRNVECVRLDKAGRQFKVLLTLSLLTDEHGAPEAEAMVVKHLNALPA